MKNSRTFTILLAALGLWLMAFIVILLVRGAFAAPPTTAVYAVCTDTNPQRIRPGGTDSVESYWWSGSGTTQMNVIASPGGNGWFKTTKTDYPTLHSPTGQAVTASMPTISGFPYGPIASYTFGVGTGTNQVDITSLTNVGGASTWPRSMHPWPAGLISVPTNPAPNLYEFYHVERGACPSAVSPFTCTTDSTCNDPNHAHEQLCYFDKHTTQADPGAPNGICFDKLGSRIGLATSTNDGALWTDQGYLINEAIEPYYCTNDNTPLSGGSRWPKAVLDPDGYVYLFFVNISGDPANPSNILNQGVTVARALATDLAGTNPQNAFYFYDAVNAHWGGPGVTPLAMNTQTITLAQYRSNVAPLNNMAAVGSWLTQGPWPGPGTCGPNARNCKGNVGWSETAWNTTLNTYTMFLHNFTQANQYNDNPPALFYFKGASLATDPLNWVPFDNWTDNTGAPQVPASYNNMSLVNYPNSAFDYYFGLVGNGGANPGCANRGAGDAKESEKCMGEWGDVLVKVNFDVQSCSGATCPNSYRNNTSPTSHTMLRFAANMANPAAFTCTYVAPPPNLGSGAAGWRR